MNFRSRPIGMPVFLGALRAKLLLGVDDRVLMIVGITALLGIFTPLLFLVAAALFFVGRVLGAISPYFFDEISVYLNWRIFSWEGFSPDDTMLLADDPKFVKEFKRAKA